MTAVFFFFGLIIGSFLNVLIARWGSEPITGRSKCPACGGQLAWYDLVPVLSWILLRARCRSCGSSISPRYLLVELGTALIFLVIALSPLPLLQQALALPIAALLIAIAAYDLRTTYIPDAWVYALSILSLLAAVLFSEPGYLLLLLLSGLIAALPIFVLWAASLFKGLPAGAWMGFGDVKLALAMGWLLGWQSGLFALFLAFIIGASVSVALLFFSSDLWKGIGERFGSYHFLHRALKEKSGTGFTMKSEIPFGPFLIAATFIVWLSNMHGTFLVDLLIAGVSP
jgi:leader peptidase (prepilin peptidase) / N-methyltransferase